MFLQKLKQDKIHQRLKLLRPHKKLDKKEAIGRGKHNQKKRLVQVFIRVDGACLMKIIESLKINEI